ncbi:exo-alpha-sialidase [Streptomyces sp. NBC_00102]|uniref:WD40/YVTN/BNR-like repeat-containing protein n=1 Tax=Streptomyces sp. NBC_00102 TaxID=2975652 RepID=UPI002257ADED|nr:exo-alpha-sialidase [Streptomyces sp. NBC_00102]MCX5400974.1 1,4-beta-glucanase [Streptomyces sp. NBC_00102]
MPAFRSDPGPTTAPATTVSTPPGRRSVLAGAAAVAAAACVLPAAGTASAAERPGRPRTERYRWRTAAVGGTGFVTGLLFHPSVRGLAYARTDIGGAYRWDAAKAHWTALNDFTGWDDWNLLGVEAMAVDPAFPDRVYLALGTYAQSWAGPGAVLRSEDRGRTWNRTDLTVRLGANEDGRGTGERLLVDPRDSGTLWLGTRHDGLLRSTDRGATWAPDASFPAVPSASGQGVTLLVAAGRTVYAGWGDGTTSLYRSTPSGGWEPVPGAPVADGATRVPVRAAYDAPSRALYVSWANGPGPNNQSDGAVRRLDTVTGAWSDVTPVVPGGADAFGYGGIAVDARRPGTVVVSTNNRWGTVDTLFRSTDHGHSWTSLKDTAVLDVSETPYLRWGGDAAKFGWWIQAVAVDPFDSRHIVFGTGATVFGTRDLVRWAPEIRGLEESSVRHLVAPPAARGARLLSGLGDIGVMYHESLTSSPSRGMASTPVFGTATGLALAAGVPSYVVRTGWPSGSDAAGAYSSDGGASWQPFASQPEIAASAPGPIAVSADGKTLLWTFIHWDGTKYPAHRSTDGGASWSEVTTFPKGATPVADPVDPVRFYAYDTDTGTVHRSTDGGASFTVGATGLPYGDAQFKMAAAPGRPGDLWLSAKTGGLHRSTDGGRTFTAVAGVQESHALGFGKAAPSSERDRSGQAGYPAVFQTGRAPATHDGVAVLRSDDAGVTWIRINDDQHQWGWTGEVITGDPRVHGRVYLGTNGRGIQYADPE